MTEKIAVVGAGVSGTVCSAVLRNGGAKVSLFDKSAAVGGRLATRHVADWRWNHGAPQGNYTSEGFAALGQRLVAEGSAQPMSKCYVGIPDMRSMLQPLLAGVEVEREKRVSFIEREGDGIRLVGCSDEIFDRVILAIPAPQAAELLEHSSLRVPAALRNVSYRPTWTLLLGLQEELPALGSIRDSIVAATIKQEGTARPSWVMHATETWSRAHVEMAKARAAELMMEHLTARLGADFLAAVEFHVAHRWRYATTARPLGKPYLLCKDGRLGLCGDWCLGPTVDHAFQSGLRLGNALLQPAKRYCAKPVAEKLKA